MTEDKLATLIRSGKGELRAAKVVLSAEGQTIKGSGVIRIKSDRLSLWLELGTKRIMPKRHKNIWTEKDFWSVSGLIDGELRFFCDRVSPGRRTDRWTAGKAVRTTQELNLSGIEVKPARGDRLSNAQKRKALGLPKLKQSRFPEVELEAVFVGCEQVFSNAGTRTETKDEFFGKREEWSSDMFIDRGADYDFALIKKKDDLHIHLRSKAGFRSMSEEDDLRRFHGLLTAVGFTHGVHPWSFRTSYWRGDRKIFDRFHPPRIAPKSLHAPFDEALGREIRDLKSAKQQSPIRIAARFFEKENVLSKEVSHLLFLCRASTTSSVEMRVRTLPLCSLFEGLVDLLFDHLQLESELRSKDPQFDAYVRERDRLCARLKKFASKGNKALERLAGSLEHAKAFRVKDKFRAVCEHFNLDAKMMDRHFESWAKKRNPLSHGKWDSSIEDFIHQSRIAGAINILVLKLMGFSGRVRAVTIGESESENCAVI